MTHTIKRLPKNSVEITCEISTEELRPYLEDAAKRLSEATTTPGFRPGHAPYSMVEKKVGAMKILEEALEPMIKKSYLEAITAEHLEPLGSPSVSMKQLAPGNPVIFTLTIALLPAVTKLADYRSVSVAQQPIAVTAEDVDRVLRDLQNMRTKEVRSTAVIGPTDHVVIDLEIFQNNAPVVGGATKNYHIIMDENHYIPGFTNELRGLAENEEKKFSLAFPAEHYQKNIAGERADFHVTIREVYTRELPVLDDAFAQTLGKPTMDGVRAVLAENIREEKVQQESNRFEQTVLERVVHGSQFDDIPDLLVNEEVVRLRQELERSVTEKGIEWKQYLAQIKKSEADLKLDFAPRAVERVKMILVIREIAKREHITVSEEEVDQEIERLISLHHDDPDARKHLTTPEYREQLAFSLRNRKAVARLKETVTKK